MIDYKKMSDLLIKALDIKKQKMTFKYDPLGNNNEWDLDFLLKAKINSQEAAELKNYLTEYFKDKLGYVTLRQYIESKSLGAYHHFLFQIDFQRVDVINVQEFERYYNKSLLDEYIVLEDSESSNSSNETNIICNHFLQIIKK